MGSRRFISFGCGANGGLLRSSGDPCAASSLTITIPEAAATADERKASLALVMRLDRACGRSVRMSSDYGESLLNLALETVRKFTPEDVARVEQFIFENRDTPSVVKEPERILMQFADLLEKALEEAGK